MTGLFALCIYSLMCTLDPYTPDYQDQLKSPGNRSDACAWTPGPQGFEGHAAWTVLQLLLMRKAAFVVITKTEGFYYSLHVTCFVCTYRHVRHFGGDIQETALEKLRTTGGKSFCFPPECPSVLRHLICGIIVHPQQQTQSEHHVLLSAVRLLSCPTEGAQWARRLLSSLELAPNENHS